MSRRALRRHHAARQMWRRLSEDRNQHYDNLDCPCWTDPAAMARFKEQPKRCSCPMCGNPRRFEKQPLSVQELRERQNHIVVMAEALD